MRIFAYNHYLDLSPNITIIKKWPCKICGQENSPLERVDTETVFRDEESFCIKCWLEKLDILEDVPRYPKELL